jgi:ferrochelatase
VPERESVTRTGVLITGFGGPDSIDAVAPFMCNLMGREPSDELVARVCRRYLAIGGSSPLVEIAGSIATKLEETLAVGDGEEVPVALGMRYWEPFIPDGLGLLKQAGCGRVVVLNLAAFESKVATDACRQEILGAAEPLDLEVVEAPLMSSLPAYADYFATSAASAIMDLEPNEGAILAFTAHSLPVADLVDNDPYVTGLERVARAVAGKLGLDEGGQNAGVNLFETFRAFGYSGPPRAWFLVYQSKGERPGAWLGPDLDELIDACAQVGAPAIIVCPIGFSTDHMETLYDLDIIAAERALDAGIEFMRAPVPNDSDDVIGALADAVRPLL